jgi:hypothetical protein
MTYRPRPGEYMGFLPTDPEDPEARAAAVRTAILRKMQEFLDTNPTAEQFLAFCDGYAASIEQPWRAEELERRSREGT